MNLCFPILVWFSFMLREIKWNNSYHLQNMLWQFKRLYSMKSPGQIVWWIVVLTLFEINTRISIWKTIFFCYGTSYPFNIRSPTMWKALCQETWGTQCQRNINKETASKVVLTLGSYRWWNLTVIQGRMRWMLRLEIKWKTRRAPSGDGVIKIANRCFFLGLKRKTRC